MDDVVSWVNGMLVMVTLVDRLVPDCRGALGGTCPCGVGGIGEWSRNDLQLSRTLTPYLPHGILPHVVRGGYGAVCVQNVTVLEYKELRLWA
jgi:hypothetical protein